MQALLGLFAAKTRLSFGGSARSATTTGRLALAARMAGAGLKCCPMASSSLWLASSLPLVTSCAALSLLPPSALTLAKMADWPLSLLAVLVPDADN